MYAYVIYGVYRVLFFPKIEVIYRLGGLMYHVRYVVFDEVVRVHF